jgi:MOSC domain-containing protein YiiM
MQSKTLELKMKLISLNVGLPREVTWKGKTVTTGIFIEPVSERVMVRSLNLDGDRQADLTVHGGLDKVIYVYPFEHYDYWQSELPDTEFPPGIFGENFTIAGLREGSEHWQSLGDRHCKTDGDTTSPTLLQTWDSVWTT